MTGKIIKGIAGFYYVGNGKGQVYQCKAKGVFRNRGVKPLVGDDVEFSILDEKDQEGNIDAILPRKNELIRPAAANVDQAMVVFALSHPAPNFNLLDRFLVMMERQNMPVILCFNKADQEQGQDGWDFMGSYRKAGYQVLSISALEKDGVEEVRRLLAGKTTVLAGPSGVGKSTLTNALYPQAEMETGEISKKIQRGRHTTRHSELFWIGEDTYMMDTPGFSSLYVEDLEPEELKNYFPEFAPFEDQCRFLGCVHVGERECGVKEAVEAGKIAGSRYDNYLLMYQELKNKRRY
ncbi:MAG: ribosome small subunit-dependent GTPase A [Lachnospiraceae bacterium]|uniref:Small ribosomal subunit biogenesis GTPase RsgA n=1 Tax=Candidatus Enterocloster excrementigallinarum TaxID=2838558 RepID=A0A9D2PTC6_9FIRM|nr:ribosome small subunit-dependent GTPase A [Lachnospiraceae bacterium]HJC66888.1 ribosome small subunit-dependent GTPase A [Candidatus Enterocloster excrementigallinarum]